MSKVTPGTRPPVVITPPPIPPAGGGTPGTTPYVSGGGGGYGPGYPVLGGGSVAGVIIPPNGFVGFGSQTPAVQAMFARATGRKGGLRSARRRRRRKAATSTPRRRRVSARSRGRKARLVKGSAAAKRHMARLRRMRKR